jgi:predicted nucleic acid-binding protein
MEDRRQAMSGAFILDCSVTMAWFFAGEATPETDGILDRLNQGGRAVVAQHWCLEVGNTLLMGERRKRCTPADASHFLGILGALAIDTNPETAANSTATTLALARAHGLTLYDAAYLELAMRASLPLATLDKDLRSAARKVGVTVLPEKI